MASKPSEPVKPGHQKSMLPFVPAGRPRDIAEIFVSGLPGAVVLVLFLLGTAALNIFTGSSNSWFALTYLPVICLLPLVVGIVAPLVLERVRGIDTLSLRRSVAASTLSGFIGSSVGAIVILLAGLLKAKPIGPSFADPISIFIFAIVLVFISTVLSAIGGAILVMFLSKALAPKSEG